MTFPNSYPSPPRIIAPGGPVSVALRTIREASARDRQRLRKSIERRIEADLAFLDALHGDPDFEDTGDDEPSLCGVGNHVLQGFQTAGGDDTEEDAGDLPEVENEHGGDVQDQPHDEDADLEDGADSEPSLCGIHVSWPGGVGDDREAGDDNGIGDIDGAGEQGFRSFGSFA